MREPLTVDRIADLTAPEREALRALSAAVYPPNRSETWSGATLEWSPAEWCVRVHGERGAVDSYIGISLREAQLDDRPVRVGGIGGVKTHPSARRRGLAARGMQRAIDFFHEQPDVAFALLVCAPHLIDYYGAQGWREFSGQLLVRQHGATVPFTFNRVMTLGIRSAVPLAGTIDLQGPPW